MILLTALAPILTGEGLYFEKRDFSALTDPSITDLVQDDRGYLWIATGGGLIRYDGDTAVLLDRKNHPELPADRIISLEFVPSAEEIWIGTVAGVVRYELAAEKIHHVLLRHSGKRNAGIEVLDMVSNGAGDVFAATADGVYRSGRGDGLDEVPVELTNPNILAVFVGLASGDDGTIWAATNDGIKKWDTEHQSFQHVFQITQPRSIAVMDNDVWVGTAGHDLFRYRTETDELKRYSVNEDTTAIAFSPNDMVWAGSRNHGIAVVNPKTGTTKRLEIDPEHPYRLPSGRIEALLRGMDDHMWVGTMDAGLLSVDIHKQNRLAYIQRSNPDSLPGGVVDIVFEDSLGYLWAGSHTGGLVRIDPREREIRRYTRDAGDFFSLSGERVSSIIEDGQGRIWVGTENGPSLYLPEVDGFEDLDGMFGQWLDIDGRDVIALELGGDNNIWVALRDGDLYQLDIVERDFKVHHYPPSSVPSELLIDQYGTLWAGSRESLRLFNADGALVQTWMPVGIDQGGIPEGGITALFEDSLKRIWLGTPTGALVFRSHQKNFLSIRLPGDRPINVSGILQDKTGNIWVSEGRKVHIFTITGEFITTMDESVGLTPSGLIKDMILSSDGRVYLGASGEIWEYESYITAPKTDPPQIFLTELKVLNDVWGSGRQLDDIDVLVLNPEESVFSIAFGTVDYRYESEYRYQYRLSDARDEWVDNGSTKSVTFAKLPPGRYRFTVRAYNENGVFSANEAGLAIRVVPSFWMRGWAIALYILVFAGLIGILIKLREGRLLKSQVKELEIARRNVLEANRKLEFLTMNDSLTGLLNRRGFDKALSHALTTAHRNNLMITVFMMDVDFFKLYNDNYGHIQGDEALRRMGKILRSVFERSTDVIARYGGEEFAVVFIGESPGASVNLANDLILAVQDLEIKHEFSSVSGYLTLSSGIATMRTNVTTTEEGLLIQADEALYDAKLAGRNRLCFTGIIPRLPDKMVNGIAPVVGKGVS